MSEAPSVTTSMHLRSAHVPEALMTKMAKSVPTQRARAAAITRSMSARG